MLFCGVPLLAVVPLLHSSSNSLLRPQPTFGMICVACARECGFYSHHAKVGAWRLQVPCMSARMYVWLAGWFAGFIN